ncbi:MAG: hypothetical protein A2341_10530 [Deltaproteobacteria bacterium RIFOXYB12_FULL_58_9]|nr:MAG: hypothetical protein A2341_10530 [Deltaproteobacteria bacterium RIFOXYB12_FULL_58_9]
MACNESGSNFECEVDADCILGERRQICEKNACTCRTDDNCAPGEYCNPFGSCQKRPPCLGNDDCGTNEICNSADPTGGKCIAATSCGSSIHCPFDFYCSPTTQKCESGCRSTGDCQLGKVCWGGECVSGGTAGDCTTCPSSPAPDATYCDYGEVCTDTGSCVPHIKQSELCDDCGGLFNQCSDGLQCLVDEVTGGAYCAPECITDADCPSGYAGCGGLILVTGTCTQIGGPCDCTSDGICPNGGKCSTAGEGVARYCECVSNNECQMLDPDLTCTLETTGDGGTFGVCATTWKACGKGEGVTCTELTDGIADCRAL